MMDSRCRCRAFSSTEPIACSARDSAKTNDNSGLTRGEPLMTSGRGNIIFGNVSSFEFLMCTVPQLFLTGTSTGKTPFWRTCAGKMFCLFGPIFLPLDGLFSKIWPKNWDLGPLKPVWPGFEDVFIYQFRNLSGIRTSNIFISFLDQHGWRRW